jgi:hypothetical protein
MKVYEVGTPGDKKDDVLGFWIASPYPIQATRSDVYVTKIDIKQDNLGIDFIIEEV